MKIVDLDGTWKFKAVNRHGALSAKHRRVTSWMTGTVPGTVHTDLMANKKIPDPFFRTNENDVQWIDSQQWIYRREFSLPKSFLQENDIELVADGLDTYATIRMNGRLVAKTSNMFISHRFDVKRYLKSGRNSIEILFDSPVQRSKTLERKHGPLRVALEPHRVYVRKAQYSFSWDWGPKLTTSGIWRNIFLEGNSSGRLGDPFVKILSLTRQRAIVRLSVTVRGGNGHQLELRVSVAGKKSLAERIIPVHGSACIIDIEIPSPELWWPNGYGGQPMYTAVLSLLCDGVEQHQLEVPFALRTVKLLRQPDREGESFIFEINGVKIFCKGVDWIPADNFIPRISDEKYETLLRLAKDAHMNMVRVWGGGIYEQDIFYDLCDRLGLMVWQDFMYACGEYPDMPWFAKEAQHEGERVVRRLRNHPCIVIWCGNNECEWLFCTENPGKTADDMRGAKIFTHILPGVCRRLDGTRPYWRSSPFGSGFPNDESNGNHHQWFVWSYWKDFREYEHDNARFITEFGFQAPPDFKTFEEVTMPEDRSPQSPVIEHHNKQVEGTERLFRFQSAHYTLGTGLDDFIYKGQLVQAEALKTAVEHWRRRKFKTAGALFWQLNDCWPVSSWAVVDSALRLKAGYYFSKKFFAPLLVSFRRTSKGVEVWVTNDRLQSINGRIEITLRSFDGNVRWKKSMRAIIPQNSSKKLTIIDKESFLHNDFAYHYLLAKYRSEEKIISENRFFFAEPKHLNFSQQKISSSIAFDRKHKEFVLTLSSTSFVKNVRIEIERRDVIFSDNYFDLDAYEKREVRFTANGRLGEVKRRLRLKWLEGGK